MKMKHRKLFSIVLAAGIVIFPGIPVFISLFGKERNTCEVQSVVTEETVTEVPAAAEHVAEEPSEAEVIPLPELKAQRVNAKRIVIQWTYDRDFLVSSYTVQKCDNRIANTDPTWVTVGEVSAGTYGKGQTYEFADELETAEPQQYRYRVVPNFWDEHAYVAADEPGILCSNVKICIDPGHFAGKNEVTGSDSYGYAEGDFTLEVAKELKNLLEKKYGIAVCMTRDSGSISLGGYRDASLDSGHISLRGAYAAEQECDLYLAIHTNANEDNANGADTFGQSIAIDKPILIVNDLVVSSDTLLAVCNAVGQNLAEVSYQLGISSHKDFTAVAADRVMEWTTAYNDSTEKQGTVVCRHGSHGQYYGTLRGAQEAGIPGVIIEHGYHTVPQMRDAAMNGELKEKWAEADAEGIVSGFGFQNKDYFIP